MATKRNPEPRRCTATSQRSGQRCRKAPVKGATVCTTHGGRAPQVVAAAQRRVDEAAARREVQGLVRRLGLEVEVDEGEALLRELYRCHASVLYLSRVVAAMGDRAADDQLEDQVMNDPRPSSEGLLVDGYLGKTRVKLVHPLVTLWQQERVQLARVAVGIGKLNLGERQTRLAEQQGAALLEVLYGVLRDLGHDPEADPKVQGAVTRHLQAVAG